MPVKTVILSFKLPSSYCDKCNMYVIFQDTGIMASTWDMYDTFEQRDQEIRGMDPNQAGPVVMWVYQKVFM